MKNIKKLERKVKFLTNFERFLTKISIIFNISNRRFSNFHFKILISCVDLNRQLDLLINKEFPIETEFEQGELHHVTFFQKDLK